MSLLVLALSFAGIGLVAWAIMKWAVEPYRWWFMVGLGIFALLFYGHAFGLFEALSAIRI